MDMNTIEDTNPEVENSINEPIYKSKDGQIITHSQLLSSGYKVNDINAGVTDKTLSLIGDTKDEDQEFQSKDGQKVNTKTLLSSGYSQKDIDGGILDGILTPIEKKKSSPTLRTKYSYRGYITSGFKWLTGWRIKCYNTHTNRNSSTN